MILLINPDIFQLVCNKETNISYEKIKNTVQLLDMDNTIPFITR
ncbi:MAG: Tex-like N-terminal domain-containing protein [Bacillota bacterium]